MILPLKFNPFIIFGYHYGTMASSDGTVHCYEVRPADDGRSGITY